MLQESCSRLFAGCGDNMVHMWDLESGTCLVRYNQYLSRFYILNDIVTGGHTINYIEGTLNNLFFICIQYIDGYTDNGV